jgi:hypothetical protein
MPETVSAEIIYYRELACRAREKAHAATAPAEQKNHLAAEARWLALVRSHELHDRLLRTLGPSHKVKSPGYAFEPEVVTLLTSAFRAIFAELAGRDEIVGVRAARRVIELAARGERDPEKLKTVILGWVEDAHL